MSLERKSSVLNDPKTSTCNVMVISSLPKISSIRQNRRETTNHTLQWGHIYLITPKTDYCIPCIFFFMSWRKKVIEINIFATGMFWSSLGGDGMMSARMVVQVLKKNYGGRASWRRRTRKGENDIGKKGLV